MCGAFAAAFAKRTSHDVAAVLKGCAGIIVSAMVSGAGGYELKRDDGTSAAEQLAHLVPKGRVVTAFTSISSALIRDPASGEKPKITAIM
jgi:predicted dinucleotide-binding enzyme